MAERNLDFDRPIDRKGTKCLKYDFAVERGMPADILPLWVADMDFRTSSYIQDAIVETASHGILATVSRMMPILRHCRDGCADAISLRSKRNGW